MRKYANHYSGIVAFLLSALVLASCDSEFYTVEGYDASVSAGKILAGEPCDNDGEIVCRNDPKEEVGNLYECSNGKYLQKARCENSFSCHDNQCGVCQNKTIVCENDSEKDGVLKKCVNGQLEEESKCILNKEPVSCYIDEKHKESRCGDCHNSAAATCVNDNLTQIGNIVECSNGEIIKTQCQHAASCEDDGSSCKIPCTEKDNFCSNDSSTMIGYMNECIGGKMITRKCPNDYPCGKNECGECIYNTVHCFDGKLNVCIDGTNKKYDCGSFFGFTMSTSCKTVIDLEGCAGLGGHKKKCYVDESIHKAYKLKWIDADVAGAAAIEKICPTDKCNADQSGCEDDPTKEEQEKADQGSGDQGSGGTE